MDEIRHFVPGRVEGEAGIAPRGIVPWLRWPVPPGVASTYVRAYTAPGDRVLVPYCQGSVTVRDIVAEGRRAVALNFDPLMVLLTRTGLDLPPPRELDAAVARLGDSQKQGMPLRRYLSDLYATTCPACLRPAVADYFVWDRDQDEPVDKHVRCPNCAWDGIDAVDTEDRDRLAEIPPRSLHYHFVRDRVLPGTGGPRLRTRIEKLLSLYSPRNLYALAELTIKIESLFEEGVMRRVLQVLLLDCLDRCSALAAMPGRETDRAARRLRVTPSARFLERNVWSAFEEALGRLQAVSGKPLAGLSAGAGVLQEPDGEWHAYAGRALVRDLDRLLPGRSLHLILTGPPPLRPAAWSLSYFWGAWLFDTEAVAPLRPLLEQRTADAGWFARVMAGSLASLGRLLADEGRLVFVLTDQRTTLVEALVTAAGMAGLGVISLTHGGGDHRLVLGPAAPAVSPRVDRQEDRDDLAAGVRHVALATAVDTIRARGEPVDWHTLHAAVWSALAQNGLVARAVAKATDGSSPLDLVAEQVGDALEDPLFHLLPASEGGEPVYWLVQPGDPAAPLADRVEAGARNILDSALALTGTQFARAVYERFPGRLSPHPRIVTACLHAYGTEPSPGYWQLRAGEDPQATKTARAATVEQLLVLGRRLGYDAGTDTTFDVTWCLCGEHRALFCVRPSAAVGEALALGEAFAQRTGVPVAQLYLVIPGSRAALVREKLAHNPLWQRAVEGAGWRFIKYKHVHQLAGEPDVDEYVLRTIVGLDPIVERDGAQIPLF